jgi:hypothetical protein
MLFVGDDWAEDHHDVYVTDADGARLASRRLPEGLAGIRGIHELIADHVDEPGDVVIGIETDRGLWLHALVRPAIRCSRSTRWRSPAIATVTRSLGRNLMRATPKCWRTWSAPTGTITAHSQMTAPRPKRSRSWPVHIRT